MPLEVFFSYSHADEELRDRLEKALIMMQRAGLIAGWHDRRIGASEDWKEAIDSHLHSAQIILLLISNDFLNSPYAYDIEMKTALKRHDRGEAIVIPIILRPCQWQMGPFARLQALPRDGKPVTTWNDPETAFLNIADGIREAILRFRPAAPLPAPEAVRPVSPYEPRKRVVDAALPSRVVKDQPTALLVLIHLPESAGLAGRLLEEDIQEIRPEDIRHAAFSAVFPLGPDGRPQPLKVAVKVTSPDFELEEKTKNIFVPVEGDGETVTFFLTPRRVGSLKVLVELTWEDAVRGHRNLRTECTAEAAPAAPPLNVARMPIEVAAPAARDTALLSRTTAAPHRGDTYDAPRDRGLEEILIPRSVPARVKWSPPPAPAAPAPPMQAKAEPVAREADGSSRRQVLIAIIGAIPLLLGSYWQFIYKPAHSPVDYLVVYVKNALNQTPIPNARAVLYRATGADQKTTDTNGTVRFGTGAEGDGLVRLEVSAQGYVVGSLNVDATRKGESHEMYLMPKPELPPK
jgi:TIR domain